MATVDTPMHKMASESLAIISNVTFDWQGLQEYLSTENHAAAIEVASTYIEMHEHFLNEFAQELVQDPGTYETHVRSLITYYAIRADQRLTLMGKGSTDSDSELDMAEADIKKALGFPAAFYAESDVESELTRALDFIQKKRKARAAESHMANLAVAALNRCDNEEQAGQLVAQYVGLIPHVNRAVDEAAQLFNNQQARRAILLDDEMIDRIGRFTQPYPPAAVQKVFAYPLTRLYFQRSVLRLSIAANSADLKAAAADLERASSYPTATYKDLDPDLLEAMSDFRPILQAALDGQQTFEARQGGQAGGSSKSGKCFIATAAYGSALAPEVMTLRSFRETTLRPHAAGRWFIRCYERCSPPLAAAIAERPVARLWVRRLLLRPLIALVGRQASCLEDKQ